MKKKLLFVIGITLLAGMLPASDRNTPQNLKVLKFKTMNETKQYMKTVAKDLGVKCNYCHDLNKFSDDSNQHKRIARSMLKMMTGLNNDFFTWKDARQIRCWTCHQGKSEPPKKK